MVAASSANLGMGLRQCRFGAEFYDDYRRDNRFRLMVTVDGEGGDQVPLGPEHLVVRAVQHGLQAAGAVAGPRCVAAMPSLHSRGLRLLRGSSCGRSCGTVLSQRDRPPSSDAELIQRASSSRVISDNAAAAVLGGAVVQITSGTAHHSAVSPRLHPGYPPVTAVIPEQRSSTAETRAFAQVSHDDARFIVSRALKRRNKTNQDSLKPSCHGSAVINIHQIERSY